MYMPHSSLCTHCLLVFGFGGGVAGHSGTAMHTPSLDARSVSRPHHRCKSYSCGGGGVIGKRTMLSMKTNGMCSVYSVLLCGNGEGLVRWSFKRFCELYIILCLISLVSHKFYCLSLVVLFILYDKRVFCVCVQ